MDWIPEDQVQSITRVGEEIRQGSNLYAVSNFYYNDAKTTNCLKQMLEDPDHFIPASDLNGLVKEFVTEEQQDADWHINVVMERHGTTRDLINATEKFCTASQEKVTLNILEIKNGTKSRIARYVFEQDGKVILSNTTGDFGPLVPGALFEKDKRIYAVAYDAKGKELVREQVRISICDSYKITYIANRTKTTPYAVKYVVGGTDFKQPASPGYSNGRRFIGWYQTPQAVGYSYFDEKNKAKRLALENDLTLYARYTDTATDFDEANYAYGFANATKIFCHPDYDSFSEEKKNSFSYDMTPGDYQKLLSLIPEWNYVAQVLIERDKNSVWSGSCHGMCVSSILMGEGDMSLSQFDSRYTYPREMKVLPINTKGDADVSNVESMINFYHLAQEMGQVFWGRKSGVGRNSLLGTESDNIEIIIKKMVESGKPGVLHLQPGEGNHAVVAYDFKTITPGKEYQFTVYDNAVGKEPVFPVTIHRTGDSVIGFTYTAECPEWEAKWKEDIFLKSFVTYEEIKQDPILVAPETVKTQSVSQGAEDTYYRFTTDSTELTISDGTRTATLKGSEVTGELEVRFDDYNNQAGMEPIYVYALPALKKGEQYTISWNDRKQNRMTMLYNAGEKGFYWELTGEGKGTLSMKETGDFATAYEVPTKQTLVLANNQATTPWKEAEVTGTSKGYSITESKGEYEVIASESGTVDLTLGAKSNEIKLSKIPVDQQGTRVQSDKDRNCVITKDSVMVTQQEFGYGVVFDSQYGSFVAPLKKVPEKSPIPKPDDPEKKGYLFTGWYEEPECIHAWDFDNNLIGSDTVLYAGWKLDTSQLVSVQFEIGDVSQGSLLLPKGSILTKDQCPTMEDGQVVTWYCDSACTTPWNFGTEKLEKDMTLYAKAKSLQVNFVAGPNTKFASVTATYGSYLDAPSKPVREGYTFVGWYREEDFQNIWDFEKNPLTQNMTLYAKWIANERDRSGKDTKISIEICEENKITFTGVSVKPVIQVRDDGVLLTENVDYNVSYQNNINACDLTSATIAEGKKPKVVVQGIGAYKTSSKFVKTFSIQQAQIGSMTCVVPDFTSVKNNHSFTKIKVDVKCQKKSFSGKDYQIHYYRDEACKEAVDGITQPGTYYVVLEASKNAEGMYTGNLCGKTEVYHVEAVENDLRVDQAVISVNQPAVQKCSNAEEAISTMIRQVKIGKTTYQTKGAGLTALRKYVTIQAVDENGTEIPEGNLYTILGTAGVKQLVLTAKPGNEMGYVGTKTVKVTVKGKKLVAKNFRITFGKPYEKPVTAAIYTGESQKPTVIGMGDFKENRDFKVSFFYQNKEIDDSCIIHAGAYQAVLTGINGYEGSVKLAFQIKPRNLADAYEKGNLMVAREGTAIYEMAGAKQRFALTYTSERGKDEPLSLIAGTDYTVAYQNNKKATSEGKYAFAKMTGKGDFCGTIQGDGKTRNQGTNPPAKKGIVNTCNYTIQQKNLSSKDITLTVNEVVKKKGEVTGVKVTLWDGEKIVPAKEYLVNYIPNGSMVSVTVRAKSGGNGTGNRIYSNYIGEKTIQTTSNLIKVSDGKQVKIVFDSKAKFFYTGKQQKPAIEIQNAAGDIITDQFEIQYGSNTKVGSGTIKIVGKNAYGYCGQKKVKFTILPKWMQWMF